MNHARVGVVANTSGVVEAVRKGEIAPMARAAHKKYSGCTISHFSKGGQHRAQAATESEAAVCLAAQLPPAGGPLGPRQTVFAYQSRDRSRSMVFS